MTTLELHPLCTLFPRITGAEFEALKSDIQANGLRQPIVVHQGFILDGGNRYRACMEIGIDPATVDFDGDNLVSYVLSVNLHRRHLSAGQQAVIVSSAQDWSVAHSKGGDRKSDQSAALHFDSVANRAGQSGASVRTQKMADAVAKKSPALARQVAHGEISLPKAHLQISEKKPVVAVVEDDEFDPVADLQDSLKSTLADNEMMGRVFDADDRLKAAMDEATRQKAIADNAERKFNAQQSKVQALAAQVTYWKNRAEKAEKSLGKLAA